MNDMDIRNYLDSTYLKTPAQSGLSEEETLKKVYDLVQEAVERNFCSDDSPPIC